MTTRVRVMTFVFVIALLVTGIIIPVVTVHGLTQTERLKKLQEYANDLRPEQQAAQAAHEAEEKAKLEKWQNMTPEQKVAEGYGLTWEEEVIYLTNKYHGTNYTTYREMAMGELEKAYKDEQYFERYGEWPR